MLWLTWRQHRIETLIMIVLLLLLAGITINTGLTIYALYDQMGITKCVSPSNSCYTAVANFNSQAAFKAFGGPTWYNLFITIPLALPLIAGIFIGVPVVARELEQGTYRLVWTQGVPWYRWFFTKISLLAVTIVGSFVILSVLLSWWSVPLSNAPGSVWQFYNIQGIVLPAYALFTFALGISAGVLVRRILPGMAIALVLFILLRIVIEVFLRPSFLPPLTYTYALSDTNAHTPAQAWVVQTSTLNRQGDVVPDTAPNVCENAGAGQDQYWHCLDDHGFRGRTTYQPIERFWLFQGIEGGIYVLLSGFLFFAAYWLIKRRIL